MKIIAQTRQCNGGNYGGNEFLVEVNETELRKITGMKAFNFKIGDEVLVNEVFDWISKLRKNSSNISRAQEQIRALADLMDTVNPVVKSSLFEDPYERESEEDLDAN